MRILTLACRFAICKPDIMPHMKEKVLIFGNGQMGNFYLNFFSTKGVEAKLDPIDITEQKEIQASVDKHKPTVIINTAAKTNLEWCEKNKLKTFNVNVLGADKVAKICDDNNIYLIH